MSKYEAKHAIVTEPDRSVKLALGDDGLRIRESNSTFVIGRSVELSNEEFAEIVRLWQARRDLDV